MALKYQKGTVYPRGKKVKMWYGKYTVYFRDERGKEVGKRRNVPLCPKAGTTKWKAEEMLHALILKETGMPAKMAGAIEDDSVTFRWFVGERYLPMRQGAWSPAYLRINSYEINHYLVGHFGRIPLGQLGTFEIQVWLNKLATMYSQSVVRHCYVECKSRERFGPKWTKLDFEGWCKCLNLLVDAVGIKPTTCRLRAECSALEDLRDSISLRGPSSDLNLIFAAAACSGGRTKVGPKLWEIGRASCR